MQQSANGIIVTLDAGVDFPVVVRLDIKDRVAGVEAEAGDGDEVGVEALGFRQFDANGKQERGNQQRFRRVEGVI